MTNQHRNQAAAEAQKFLAGNIPDDQLQAALDTITNPDEASAKRVAVSAPSAHGSVLCVFFYWRISLSVNSGKSFLGNAGGIGFAGGASTNGNIYLAKGVTMEELYADTDGFQFNSAAVYLNVNFFSKDHKFLGSFQGGGVGTCPGTGGGTGKWS